MPTGRLTWGDTVYREKQPVAENPVAGLWMDHAEVSNDEFAVFVGATAPVTTARSGAWRYPHGGGAACHQGRLFLVRAQLRLHYRAGARQPQDHGLGASHLGFRTVLSAPGP